MKVYQNISIHQLRIQGISNSAVLQIGVAGTIKSLSNLYNTGQFTRPAPLTTQSSAPLNAQSDAQSAASSWVPFAARTDT